MERTYVFNSDGGAGGGSRIDINSLLPGMARGIDPYSEDAAYLEGEIAQKMFPVAKRFICEHCRKGILQ